MLNHRIYCVGRRAKDPLLDAADDYLKRLKRYAKADLVRLRDSDPAAEAHALLEKVEKLPRASSRVVVLDERGEEQSTRQLATHIEGWERDGMENLVWAIGGADGHTDAVRERGDAVWRLSKLTLPHRFALALLAEQLYRAHTILRGEGYHRE